MIYAIYNPSNVAKVVTGVDEEIAKILKDGVTEDELKKAKDGFLRQQEMGRTEDRSLASTLAGNLFIGRTMQYQADLEKAVKGLDVEAVNAASQAPRSQEPVGDHRRRLQEGPGKEVDRFARSTSVVQCRSGIASYRGAIPLRRAFEMRGASRPSRRPSP